MSVETESSCMLSPQLSFQQHLCTTGTEVVCCVLSAQKLKSKTAEEIRVHVETENFLRQQRKVCVTLC